MMIFSVKKIVFFALLTFVLYTVCLNVIVVPSHIVVLESDIYGICSPRVYEEKNVYISITGNVSLDYGMLCYKIFVHRHWIRDPAPAVRVDTYVVSNGIPWYIRGYSIEVSYFDAYVDGLPPYVLAVPILNKLILSAEPRYHVIGRTFEIEVPISGRITEVYHGVLHVFMKLRITEWSILGPIKTYGITILNKAFPITIEIKEVYLEDYRS